MPQMPFLSTLWSNAAVIIDPAQVPPRPNEPGAVQYVNDFCLARDRQDRWHCIGIVGDHGNRDLFHAKSHDLKGPYAFLPRVESGQPNGDGYNMWAPFVTWENEDQALLLYGHMEKAPVPGECDASLRMLAATGKLEDWAPIPDRHSNRLFAEPHVRDPQILRSAATGNYLLYYVVGDGWTSPEERNVVRVRQSIDLKNWSEPRTVLAPPPGYRAAESIFVLERDGLFYLWVCGFDYGVMSLYVSEDPFCFGHSLDNRLAEMSGHAPEIVTMDGKDWIACVSIASAAGNPPGWHDLPGVRIQELCWREMPAELEAKIYRREHAPSG